MIKNKLKEENILLKSENDVLLKRLISAGDKIQILTEIQLQNERAIANLSHQRKNLRKEVQHYIVVLTKYKKRIAVLEEIIEEDTIMGLPA